MDFFFPPETSLGSSQIWHNGLLPVIPSSLIHSCPGDKCAPSLRALKKLCGHFALAEDKKTQPGQQSERHLIVLLSSLSIVGSLKKQEGGCSFDNPGVSAHSRPGFTASNDLGTAAPPIPILNTENNWAVIRSVFVHDCHENRGLSVVLFLEHPLNT